MVDERLGRRIGTGHRGLSGVTVIAAARNLGAAGRNLAVQRTSTPYVAFCDDDTWWEPGALDRAADLLDACPRLASVTGRILVKPAAQEAPIAPELRHSPAARAALAARLRAAAHILAGASMLHAAAFAEAGGFSPGCGWAARRNCSA